MTDYTREIRRNLTDGLALRTARKGRYERWINPSTGEKVTVDSKVRSRAVANKIMKEAGLGKKF